MIADVVFDAPVGHPFSYRVPHDVAVAPGQRVVAPLRGAARTGMVVALRAESDERLKPILRVLDPSPILSPRGLDLVRWIAAESLSSVGSTCAALLPPAVAASGGHHPPAAKAGDGAAARHDKPDLLIGAGRERRLLERIESAASSVLVLTADVEAAGRWAQRLARIDHVVRLDSGTAEGERAKAWGQLATGAVRLATGTRSALLAPLPAGATLALIDEHDPAHKPPGPPRLHSRDIVLERARREGLRAVFASATPSVEMWWRADSGRAAVATAPPAGWPSVTIADTRGILRREPLTPPLARAIREALGAGRRAFLLVSRLAASLACDECGAVLRCVECGIALGYSRAGATLGCRLCGTPVALPETCPGCQGRRLTAFGWSAERVEHAVRRRFPAARVARYDADSARGARGDAQRAAAAAADVVIGTRGALRLFGPAALGVAGFVSPDPLLRLPDFRAGERTFALLWAAAERVRPDGALVIQSQHPTHYAFDAVTRQDLADFYTPELKFRAELGYPPFRRLAVITVRADGGAEAERRADDIVAALAGAATVTVYPPAVDRRERSRRIVVKGGADLPRVLEGAVAGFRARPGRRRGIIDVEVDPVEWRF